MTAIRKNIFPKLLGGLKPPQPPQLRGPWLCGLFKKIISSLTFVDFSVDRKKRKKKRVCFLLASLFVQISCYAFHDMSLVCICISSGVSIKPCLCYITTYFFVFINIFFPEKEKQKED